MNFFLVPLLCGILLILNISPLAEAADDQKPPVAAEVEKPPAAAPAAGGGGKAPAADADALVPGNKKPLKEEGEGKPPSVNAKHPKGQLQDATKESGGHKQQTDEKKDSLNKLKSLKHILSKKKSKEEEDKKEGEDEKQNHNSKLSHKRNREEDHEKKSAPQENHHTGGKSSKKNKQKGNNNKQMLLFQEYCHQNSHSVNHNSHSPLKKCCDEVNKHHSNDAYHGKESENKNELPSHPSKKLSSSIRHVLSAGTAHSQVPTECALVECSKGKGKKAVVKCHEKAQSVAHSSQHHLSDVVGKKRKHSD